MTKNIKKIIGFLFCLLFCAVICVGVPQTAEAAEVAVDEINFPDENFRDYVTNKFDTDKNGKLSDEEISKVTDIRVVGVNYNIIKDLKGIEYFTALTLLDCSHNQLTNLDISKNTALTYLDCSFNQLKSLDVSRNTALTYLCLLYNKLKSLDVSRNTALTILNCGYNNLTSLDVSRNTALTELYCYFNSWTSLDISKNMSLENLVCYSNQLAELKLHSQTYDKLLLSKSDLHFADAATISDLQNITIVNGIIKVTDITKPAKYKADGKDFTIIYADTLTTPSPGPVVQSGSHIFNDYKYNSPITGSPVVIYGNGKTQTIDGKKVNNKIFTAYTDILASYKHTLNNNGQVKSSVGKVIVGITKSDIKPEVNSKNKITDTSASKIARAKIKNGQITVTAVGKEGGLVYLWVIDTGGKGISACCPVDVKLAPVKLEVQDKTGSKLAKNTRLENGKTLNVSVAGLAGTTRTEDCTYTATVPSKYQGYVTVTPVEGSTNQFVIKATGLKNNKDTKAAVTFQCDQNGKKANLSLTIIK